MNKRFITVFFALILSWLPVYGQNNDSIEITKAELHDHIQFLASDSLQGRKAGTVMGHAAAEYVRKQILEEGFQPLGDQGFQHFDIVTSVSAGDDNSLQFSHFRGEVNVNFNPLSFSANTSLSAPVEFVGYGFDFDADSLAWHDYEDVDVSGKWAMILRSNPEPDNPHSVYYPHSGLREKVLVAKDHGAAGVLFVSGEQFDKKDDLIKVNYDRSQSSVNIPVLLVKRTIADSLLAPTGQTIAGFEKKLNETTQPNSFAINTIVQAEADIIKNTAGTQNVVALLPGNDDVLKNQYIVLGAHYDHLGFGGPGSGSRRPDTVAIHNGADDNASGVAAILEIAEKFSGNHNKLRRSVIFVAFGAEEMGILGSKYFVEHPLIDLDKIVFMFNLDMVGRLNTETKALKVGGTGTAVGLSDLVQKTAANYDFAVDMAPEGYGPSDHASFYAKDIPVLFFFTNAHEDYHTPSDDIEKINFQGEKAVADFAYKLAWNIANRSDILAFQEAGPKEPQRMGRRFKVTLGIMPDYASTEKKGLRVDVVIPDRPAAHAGMKKGDIIVAMDGKPVKDIYEYMHRLSEFEPGQRISVEVLRNGEKEILIVEL